MEQEVAKSWLANQGKFSHQVNWDAIRLNREKMIEVLATYTLLINCTFSRFVSITCIV